MEEHHIYNCSDAEDPTDIDSLWEARQEITQCNPEWTDYGQVTDDDFD